MKQFTFSLFKNPIIIGLLLLPASLFITLGGVMIVGKTSSEIRNEDITDRSITLRRIDHFKENVILIFFSDSEQE